jgi:hypothetical protein
MPWQVFRRMTKDDLARDLLLSEVRADCVMEYALPFIRNDPARENAARYLGAKTMAANMSNVTCP